MYGYMQGNGHTHYGPGTSLTQFLPVGMGGCETIQSLQSCCDSCSDGGSCGRGLGCACENKGMGLFESGLDFSQWSYVEWTLVGLGSYMFLSTVFATSRGVDRVSDATSRGYRKVKRIARGRRRRPAPALDSVGAV
jgi:hypothetical protein